MTSLALISDLHANLPALEAVVAAIRRRRPDAVYVLGDIVNGCVWPAETLDLLAAEGWPMLLGNHDDAVLQLGTPRMETRYHDRRRYATLWWTRAQLDAARLAALEALPLTFGLTFDDAPPLRLIHGLPGNFFVGFRPDSPEEWALRKLEGVAEPVVAGGHTHVPMVRRFDDRTAADRMSAAHRTDADGMSAVRRMPAARWTVVNSGSVGASYDGDTRAAYAWLSGDASGWRAEICRVPYDVAAVEAGYRDSSLARERSALSLMFQRSVLTGLPWVSDFAWWLNQQPADVVADQELALRLYQAAHGPGRWAFPYV